MLDYETVFNLISYLKHETEYIPWAAALGGLSYVNKMLKRTSAYGDFKRFLYSTTVKEERVTQKEIILLQ